MRLKRQWVVVLVIVVVSALAFLLLYLRGGSRNKEPFKICVEENSKGIVKALGKELTEKYPGMKVEFVVVPRYDDFMENNLSTAQIADFEQLQVKIMSGSGPDLYIFPAANTRLFGEPYKAAQSGVFADMTEEAGQSTNFAACNQAVMAAGKVNDRQYIIPLTFSATGILCSVSDKAALEKLKEPIELLRLIENRNGGCEVFQKIKLSEQLWGTRAKMLINWEKKLLNDTEPLKELLEFEKKYSEEGGTNALLEIPDEGTPYRIAQLGWDHYQDKDGEWTSLSQLLQKGREDLTLLALPNGEGGVTATVESYGVIGANSKYKKEAQEVLLDLLLSEEWQGSTEKNLRFSANFRGMPVRADCSGSSLLSVLEPPFEGMQAPEWNPHAGEELEKLYNSLTNGYLWQNELDRIYIWSNPYLADDGEIDYERMMEEFKHKLVE